MPRCVGVGYFIHWETNADAAIFNGAFSMPKIARTKENIMAKFANTPPVKPKAAVTTKAKATRTYNGGTAVEYKPKSELFSLAAVNMSGEDTFYESAKDRDQRFVKLIHAVAAKDPAWIANFIPFLRNEMNMRSASIVMAAEYVKATNGGEGAADVVASALVRADEPAEIIGYWHSQYGRSLPRAIKRGIEVAANRWNTYTALKYDGNDRSIRLGDVIQLAHPRPKDEAQTALFKFLLDRRYGNAQDAYGVESIDKALAFSRLTNDEKRAMSAEDMAAAGITWERLSSTGAMDAAMWEKAIPSMGYMALLRNLRNFEEAKISKKSRDLVLRNLVDPTLVAKSRQFPFRFLSAYKANDSDTWKLALSEALDLSTQNIPVFPGKTLVLVDVSGSMDMALSARSTVSRAEVGFLFGAALAKKNAGSVDFVVFGTSSKAMPVSATGSVLDWTKQSGRNYGVGHSTNTWPAVQKHYKGHDRVIVFTDEQSNHYGGKNATLEAITNKGGHFYNFNLGGYGRSDVPVGSKGVYELNGFTDVTFRQIPLLERGQSTSWPWEVDA